jgi:hypothetical protein
MIGAGMAAQAEEARMLAGTVVVQRLRRAAACSEFHDGVLAHRPVRAAFQVLVAEPCPCQHGRRGFDMAGFA